MPSLAPSRFERAPQAAAVSLPCWRAAAGPDPHAHRCAPAAFKTAPSPARLTAHGGRRRPRSPRGIHRAISLPTSGRTPAASSSLVPEDVEVVSLYDGTLAPDVAVRERRKLTIAVRADEPNIVFMPTRITVDVVKAQIEFLTIPLTDAANRTPIRDSLFKHFPLQIRPHFASGNACI